MKRQKPFTEMTSTELAGATREFDREFISDSFGAPPAQAAQRWRNAKRKRGRPRIGKGAAKLRISLERDLLRRTDAYAKAQKLTRSQLIAMGLLAVLPKAG